MRTESYRGWVIKYDPPPVPFRNCDWAFVHRDFDGAPDAGDHRYGHAASVVEAKAAIDSLIEDEQLALCTDNRRLHYYSVGGVCPYS